MVKTKKKEIVVKESKKEVKTEENQFKWFLIIIALVFIITIAIYFYVQGLSHFSYAGVKWDKIKQGNLDLYYSRFHVFYDKNSYYNLYLRNDPKENNIPININYTFAPEVIISVDSDAGECRSSAGVILDLGMFLTGAGGRNVTGAVTNETIAKEQNLTYADCTTNFDKTVIIIQKSEVPSINVSETNENCFIINVGDCENYKASERFIVGAIAQTYGVKI